MEGYEKWDLWKVNEELAKVSEWRSQKSLYIGIWFSSSSLHKWSPDPVKTTSRQILHCHFPQTRPK